jgi:HEPN domain-containing protein
MTDPKREEIRLWLLKSRQDLAVAELLIEQQRDYLGIAVYHCQQSVEKGLKAYLTHQDVLFKKTHDLTVLVRLCMEFDERFEALLDAAEVLTPYATQFRYPSDQVEPDKIEAENALTLSSQALAFIQNALSKNLLLTDL